MDKFAFIIYLMIFKKEQNIFILLNNFSMSGKAKVRPPNGPGSNGMRGGPRLYSNKTVVGPWLDDLGGPAGFKRGFTTVDFETEAQHAQLGYNLHREPEFGAGLPTPDSVGRPPASTADLFKGTGKADFLSTTRIQQNSVVIAKKVSLSISQCVILF
jgi:hypothetical protein